uniref:Fibronectin type-III domain-containing protein n=1 Tax=Kalanchoe fedtschenkoi TaxID=63787 RepID=A0A7N0VHB5_KALFE
MDSSLEGVMLDPSKCSKMSMEEKRELVYELSKWSHGATDLLQTWSRQDILQILCAEMGKERKYTGLTKLKIIENLMKIVSEKKKGESQAVAEADQHSIPASVQKAFKRQRKTDNPSRLPSASNNMSSIDLDSSIGPAIYCKNSACKALMKSDDAFCRRCSCCICYKYDDNKDPSLWLNCSSEPPFQGKSCGLSCHLECAFRNGKSGIGKDGRHAVLDGSFYCVSCGKLNDLLGCWRKQVVIAKETRRVDILCYRLSLSQKLISGTKKFQKIYEIVEEAVKKLEAELGPITGLPVKTARGIVNRLDSGPEVQKICATAIDLLDSVLNNSTLLHMPNYNHQSLMLVVPDIIRLEDVSPTAVTVVLASEASSSGDIIDYLVWHRKASDADYPVEPVCSLSTINGKFTVSGLSPGTEYIFKVASSTGCTSEVWITTSGKHRETYPRRPAVERSHSPTVNCSSLSNPSSVEDETNNVAHFIERNENSDNDLDYCNGNDKVISGSNGSASVGVGQEGTPADSVSVLDELGLAEKKSSKPMSDPLKNNDHVADGEADVPNDNESDTAVPTGLECVPFVSSSEGGLPITPCKLENSKDGHGKRSKHGKNDTFEKVKEPQGGGSSSKKRRADRSDGENDDFPRNNSSSDRDLAYYVKVIRWLECEGYIETNFRQKFLTWYSLRASTQEARIVKVFVDAFIEDPESLAGQLVDTFSETISNNGSSKSSVVPAGFCMKLWH